MLPKLVRMRRFEDERGWFSESYNAKRFATAGMGVAFVQDNHSFSAQKGTLRGLHLQAPPHAQAKLVRCTSGVIWDVAVDVRTDSPTRGKWVSAQLTAARGEQMYIPVGFAHGFLTMTENAEVQYKVSDFWAPECEGVVRWNDPALAIAWPLEGAAPILTGRDALAGGLGDLDMNFPYQGEPLMLLEELLL